MTRIVLVLLCWLTLPAICEAGSFSKSVARQFYQADSCGPVALTVACRIAGRLVTWEQVCEVTKFDGSPASLLDLSRGANQLGFKAQAYGCSVKQLKKIGGPGILDYPRGHFSVFLGWSPKGLIRVGDLRTGLAEVPSEDFQKTWGGHLLTLSLSPKSRRNE